MKKLFLIAMTAAVFASCGKKQETTTNLYTPDPETFDYVVDAFADMQKVQVCTAFADNIIGLIDAISMEYIDSDEYIQNTFKQ